MFIHNKCTNLVENSNPPYKGHLYIVVIFPQVTTIDRFDCIYMLLKENLKSDGKKNPPKSLKKLTILSHLKSEILVV